MKDEDTWAPNAAVLADTSTSLEDGFRVPGAVRHSFVYVSTGPPVCHCERGGVAVSETSATQWRSRALQYLLAAFLAITGPVLAAGQPDTKLIGTGAVAPSEQGWSVALSADGNTAIVGGAVDNRLAGAAWVYTRRGNMWTQQGGKLVGTGAVGQAGQGISVALSADGNTAIVGGPYDDKNTGAAWVYFRKDDVWVQQGSKLVGSGAVGGAAQGSSVALSADGSIALVGGAEDDSYTGAVWVYSRSGGVWSQQGSKLVGTGAVGKAGQGASIALSADGNTAILGGVADDVNTGAAWIFIRARTVWSQQGHKLVGTGTVGNARQGHSVALSADGNTALVGGVGDNSYVGAVWVFTRARATWSQQGNKLVGAGAVGGASEGHSVALSADGNTAIVGGPHDNSYTGATWVYARIGNIWSQQGNKLVGIGAVGSARHGSSVALSANGSTAIVGGLADDRIMGAAWVHSRSDGVWTSQYLAY
jgi:hypothetical protein